MKGVVAILGCLTLLLLLPVLISGAGGTSRGAFADLPKMGVDEELEDIVLGKPDNVPQFLTKEERIEYKEKVEEMFYHAYESYMSYAFPHDEVKPLSCKGHDVLSGMSLTLIDCVDTLFIMGNNEEYVRQIKWIIENTSFDRDVVVVTFEMNIRFVGALLSNHLICSDPEWNVYPGYNGELLALAKDCADRLLVAFETPTGLPMKKINLRKGSVEGTKDEIAYTSVADAGTYLLEFGILSELLDDPKYINAAKRAARRIYDSRSAIDLVGTNLNVYNGNWEMKVANTGSGVDSYYEYLLKHAILFDDPASLRMFRKLYKAVRKYLKQGEWYLSGDMDDGLVNAPYVNSLQAFLPGLQTLLNDTKQTEDAVNTLGKYIALSQHYGFFPEVVDILLDQVLDGRWPLRPELAESTWYMSGATKNPIWTLLASEMVDNIDEFCRVPCGFASIKNVQKKSLHDSMESFFLGETLKYLYMIFDVKPVIGERRGSSRVVFNTEAHPLWVPLSKTGERMAKISDADIQKEAASEALQEKTEL